MTPDLLGLIGPWVPLAVVVLVAAGFWHTVLSRSAQAGNRVRALRWRIRCRLKPGPGYASLPELIFRWGRLPAIHHGKRARPGLDWWDRICTRSTDFAVRLGRGPYARRCYGRMEDMVGLIAPQRSGKALALDTPVPTPAGWTTMGALQDGDLVFDESGQPCKVLHAWPVRLDRPCYEVVFSDGSVITADADHLWFVHTFKSRRSERSQKRYRHDSEP